MSSDSINDDTPQSGPAEPSESETRELMERLRNAPADEVLADLLSTLLSAAQVKLGRRDARLFIDLCGQVVEYAGPHVSTELTTQVETVLGQLRMAQVSAENEAAAGEPEPNDLAQVPRPPAAHHDAPRADQAPPAPSRLWVPGQ